MPDTHRLTITATGPTSKAVHLDGNNIANALTGLTLTMDAGRVPEAHLELLLLDVTEIQDTEAHVLIPDSTRDALIALGWTPPGEPDAEETHLLDQTCPTFSEHGWGRCVEPLGHAGSHMFRNPATA